MRERLQKDFAIKAELCMGRNCPLRAVLERIQPGNSVKDARRICEEFDLQRSGIIADRIPSEIVFGQPVAVYECRKGLISPKDPMCGIVTFVEPGEL